MKVISGMQIEMLCLYPGPVSSDWEETSINRSMLLPGCFYVINSYDMLLSCLRGCVAYHKAHSHSFYLCKNMTCIPQGLTAYNVFLGNGIISTNSLSTVGIIPAWFGALPHDLIRCNVHTGNIWEEVGGTNMELHFANARLGNLSGCTVMTLLLTITLQGNSRANQLSVLTPAGPPQTARWDTEPGQPYHQLFHAPRRLSAHTSNIVHRPTQCFHLLNKTPTTLAWLPH